MGINFYRTDFLTISFIRLNTELIRDLIIFSKDADKVLSVGTVFT